MIFQAEFDKEFMKQQYTDLLDALQIYLTSQSPHFSDLGLKNLSENYCWPKKGQFPSEKLQELSGKAPPNGTKFEKNVWLKKNSAEIWKSCQNKAELAKWIVADWGGIRTNKPSTLCNYVSQTDKGCMPNTLEGVASYSKLYSFSDPDRYAILDARVLASLNAIQYLSGLSSGIAFPYPSSRNKKIEGFKSAEGFSLNDLVSRGWIKVKKQDVYCFYLSILRAVKTKVEPRRRLFEIEMSLFADAEELICRAQRARG